MSPSKSSDTTSPWRGIFEEVRKSVGNERDGHGVLGSINWLRHNMEVRGANPNVVRNIIYRDKGRLPDKRVLFEILDELWRSRGHPPIHAPELQVLLAPGSGNDQEVLQLLGREKRRAYRSFVQGVRSGAVPKLTVVGRPGSGKTLLTDYIEQALEVPPLPADRMVRLEFSGTDLATALTRLGARLGVASETLESKLVKVGASSAFAVQADAQADVARTILDAARQYEGHQVLLLHVSQTLGGQESLGLSPLRLNTPDVPRVSAAEWLWVSLFEPIARLMSTSLLVSMTELPMRAQQRMGHFDGPIKLTPPTASEARRFVRARLPNAAPARHEEIVQRAGRSFEELRTLTLLAEIRDPDGDTSLAASERSMTQLSQLLDLSGDERLRGFLAAVAVLSLPDFASFPRQALAQLRAADHSEMSSLESAFLDQVPGKQDMVRCFSRQLARALRERLLETQPAQYQALHQAAAVAYRDAASADPGGEAATRYLNHMFEARDWDGMGVWMTNHATGQSLVRRLWQAATRELVEGPRLERLAVQVAAHYVKLGTYQHPDVRDAFKVLAASGDVSLRVWTTLKRSEGLILRSQYDQAEALVRSLPEINDPVLRAEAALAASAIARWHGRFDEAAELVDGPAVRGLRKAPAGPATDAVRVKVGLWSGLIAKGRGDLLGALRCFDEIPPADDLDAARVAFQRGDVFMRLGHYDSAMQAMEEAVDLAHRSEALFTEQTRYLTRRATLHRRRGDLAAADRDFEAARRALLSDRPNDGRRIETPDQVERDFWLARIEDEAALALMAAGRFDEAALVFAENQQSFLRYQEVHGVDVSYRVLRSKLRLAIAYGCRAVGQPFKRPFAITEALNSHGPDLQQARRLIQDVVHTLETSSDRRHLGHLTRDTLVAANLFAADGATALAYSEQALQTSSYPYHRAQSHAHAAAGALRKGDPQLTEAHVKAGEEAIAESLADAPAGERGDLELAAWLIALDAVAAVQRGQADEAARRLAAGLERDDLRACHGALLRQVGEAVEARGLRSWTSSSELGRMLELKSPLEVGALRLSDAMVARWSQLHGTVASGVVPTSGAAVPVGASEQA